MELGAIHTYFQSSLHSGETKSFSEFVDSVVAEFQCDEQKALPLEGRGFDTVRSCQKLLFT